MDINFGSNAEQKAKPAVSIIMPTYNRCRFITKAIESVIEQTYSNWELIIVDDGSTDQTSEVVGKYVQNDSRIRYIKQKNAGCAAARNRALAEATGAYIAFIDDDDVYEPNKLQIQVEYLNENPKIGFVYSDSELIDVRGNHLKNVPEIPQRSFLELITGFAVPPIAIMVKKECFDRVGLFCTELRNTDDYDMWLRIAKEFQFAYLPAKVALYVWHDGNLTLNQRKTTANLTFIYKRLMKQRLSEDERRQVIRSVLQFTYWYADEKRAKKEYEEAFFYYRMAFKFDPLIGSVITWGQIKNKAYLVVRPYLVTFYCGVLALFDRLQGKKILFPKGIQQ